ncbi:MAG TPA: 4Fe-4S dicluster domain-containing protein [Thermodesulfobacteriota bacterium]|nr:4Fe-4S dicluster domain-containing protein [Thermodesulfobacteriota bacterium]
MKEESPPKKKKKTAIDLNLKWCKGCSICVDACPKKVFEKSGRISEKGFPVILVAHPELCTGCLQCEMLCPDLALNVKTEKAE